MEEIDLKYNKNYYSVMANKIIRGKQKMTIYEAKLIRILISQIKKDDENFRMYRTDIKNLAEFLGTDRKNIQREIRNVCKNLMRQIVEIENGKDWEILHWVSYAKYDSETGTIMLMLSEEIAPYVLALKERFTRYQTKNILTMQSFYAIRLYELLQMRIGMDKKKTMMYQFGISELRTILECEKKFKQIGEFKRFVLDIAIKEISDMTEYKCTYECNKTGRIITDIVFYLELKGQEKEEEEGEKEQEQKELDLDDLIDQLREIISENLKTKEYKAILEAANNDIKLIQEKYELSKKQQKIENLVGWLIKAIEGNYSEPIEKRKRTSFNNIEGRQYDYDELEKQLLGVR